MPTEATIRRYGPPAERFWPKVDRSGDCWNWIAARTRDGYGQFRWSVRGAWRLAHRVAYELSRGAVPEGLCVLHKCDNRACCNPSHLFLGTNRDNVNDRTAKGRHVPAYGDRNGSRKYPESRPRGEASKLSKLTEEQVREMRREYATGTVSWRQLARRHGVGKTTVQYAVKGKTWEHVDETRTPAV